MLPNTTLHLSFTDFEIPINVGTRSIRDTEAILIESVVSLHDRGRWVGDLGIISALSSYSLQWARSITCSHSKQDRSNQQMGMEPALKPVSIDSWDELLDLPSEDMIVRAHENWLARLAAATISVEKKRITVFLPSDVCWKCLARHVSNLKGSKLVSLLY